MKLQSPILEYSTLYCSTLCCGLPSIQCMKWRSPEPQQNAALIDSFEEAALANKLIT